MTRLPLVVLGLAVFACCSFAGIELRQVARPKPEYSRLFASTDAEIRRAGIMGAVFQVLAEPMFDVGDGLAGYYKHLFRRLSVEDLKFIFKVLGAIAPPDLPAAVSEYERVGRMFMLLKDSTTLSKLPLDPHISAASSLTTRLALWLMAFRWSDHDRTTLKRIANSKQPARTMALEALESARRQIP